MSPRGPPPKTLPRNHWGLGGLGLKCRFRVSSCSLVYTNYPGGNPGANLPSIFRICRPILVAFVWELIKETIVLPLGCLQGGGLRGGAPQAPVSVGWIDCSQVDMIHLRYKSVNFGAERSWSSLNWCAHIHWDRDGGVSLGCAGWCFGSIERESERRAGCRLQQGHWPCVPTRSRECTGGWRR